MEALTPAQAQEKLGLEGEEYTITPDGIPIRRECFHDLHHRIPCFH